MTHTQHWRRSIADRFWEKVDRSNPDGCWEWQASTNVDHGYGQFTWDGTVMRSHRVAYTISVGPIPKGKHVMHSCDNRKCCNPAHLSVGTHQDNMRDRTQKGRHGGKPMPGELNGSAKLTAEQVIEIRRLMDTGVPGTRIARDFGIDQTSASNIFRRKSWKHMP